MAKKVKIGQTTALIPEAGSAVQPEWLNDGQSGNTNFPYSSYKALATVGEVDAKTKQGLTGYPDGQAAWLLDDDTVRVAYQSESYAHIYGRTPAPETYPQEMETGVTFSGSKIHTIDYSRDAFADFMGNDSAASDMVEGSGFLFNRVFNLFGEEVTPKNDDPEDLAAKWGNQTLPSGDIVEFASPLSETDFYFHSFCGAWYEPANRYGEGQGFSDDIWLMAEEWDIGFGNFAPGVAGEAVGNETMGLAAMAVDVANEVAYSVPALGQTGYEKIAPLNTGESDYVVMVTSGYNHGLEPAPLKIYVGRKGYDAEGNPITDEHSERDQFLGRNGMLWGQLYGQTLKNKHFDKLGIDADEDGNGRFDDHAMDAYLTTQAKAGDSFKGRFYPTSYQWGGWDEPTAVGNTEMRLWERPEEQPRKHTFFNGDTKAEHNAVDPSGKPRFFQNMTDEGALLGFNLKKLTKQLRNNPDADGNLLPDYINYKAVVTIPATDGSLTIDVGDEGLAHAGEANPDGSLTHATHVEKGVSKTVSNDGLYWAKGKGGDVLILDEDSGNDYGERKYALPLNGMELRDAATGYFLGAAGGTLSPRYEAGAAALAGAFSAAGTNEFSGSWDVTGMVTRKDDGSFYSKEELSGSGMQDVADTVDIEDHTYIGVVQARPESGGQVEDIGGDAGGQVFMFEMNGFF